MTASVPGLQVIAFISLLAVVVLASLMFFVEAGDYVAPGTPLELEDDAYAGTVTTFNRGEVGVSSKCASVRFDETSHRFVPPRNRDPHYLNYVALTNSKI